MIWRRKAFTELALAITSNCHCLDEGRTSARLGTLSKFLCRLHLNEPGCVVGEQRHGLVAGWGFELGGPFLEAMGQFHHKSI